MAKAGKQRIVIDDLPGDLVLSEGDMKCVTGGETGPGMVKLVPGGYLTTVRQEGNLGIYDAGPYVKPVPATLGESMLGYRR